MGDEQSDSGSDTHAVLLVGAERSADGPLDALDETDPASALHVGRVTVLAPDVDGDTLSDALAAADALVVTDFAGVDRAAAEDAAVPVVALVADPTGPVATSPVIDAVATTAAAVGAQVDWLRSRPETSVRADPRTDPAHTDPGRTDPARIERLHAGAARLASARSPDEAYRTAITIAEEVFSFHHCTIGVVSADDEWVEPVAVSSGVTVEDCSRVRMGAGVVGTVLASGNSRLIRDLDHDRFGASIAVPVGDRAVFQAVATGDDAYDDADLELAELLASHLAETLARLSADEDLRTERDRLVALFENVPDAAVEYDYVDGDPIVRRVNPAFEEVFGYSAEEIVGESVDDYIVPGGDHAIEEADELNRKLQAGDNVRQEVTRRTADGESHFILHVIPLQLEAENVSGYAIYTDVTERREREATLRRQNDRLDEFTSIVSHDLRNPLSVAKGYTDLASETRNWDHLDRVNDALDRMDELVTDLLALAREGSVVGEKEPVSLAELAREAWSSVDTKGAELRIADDHTVEADPNRVRELLENLFRNAVEHGTPEGTVEVDAMPADASPSVDASPSADASPAADALEDGPADPSADPAADQLTVTVGAAAFRSGDGEGFYVEDDGQGLPDGETDRVFESGFSTGEGGTGLGLAISRHIADAHGWDVRALAGEEGGARFEFQTEN